MDSVMDSLSWQSYFGGERLEVQIAVVPLALFKALHL